MNTDNNRAVYVNQYSGRTYPTCSPYHPDRIYPEFSSQPSVIDPTNLVFGYLRDLLHRAGLDRAHFDTRDWNPLGELIQPGNTVLLKPNMVLHKNELKTDTIDCVITHGSLIRAVLDYVFIALNGQGQVIVADAPIQSCDFQEVIKANGLIDIQNHFRQTGRNFEIIDLRNEWVRVNPKGEITQVITLPGDPAGYAQIDLGRDSLFAELDPKHPKLRVTSYDPSVMKEHHNQQVHEYLIAKSVLAADVVINLPKPKTHRKAGITGAMKNLVGINGNKDWLPHHRNGSRNAQGDEYDHRSGSKALLTLVQETIDRCDIHGHVRTGTLLKTLATGLKLIKRKLIRDRDPYQQGSWWGNDTIWRTVGDLNRIFLYADTQGALQETVQRKVISILDMIISGEKEGPLKPTAKPCGVLMLGYNSLALDTALAAIMGFDYTKLPSIIHSYQIGKYPILTGQPTDIEIHANVPAWCAGIDRIRRVDSLQFTPSAGWAGHIEAEEISP